MSCLVGYRETPVLVHPDATAPVAIPRALANAATEPHGTLDAIARISRALPDGDRTGRLVDVSLDNLVVPRLAQVAPNLDAYAALVAARRPTAAGLSPSWPLPGLHRAVLEKHFADCWTEEAMELKPRDCPTADPARWMLMSWLDAHGTGAIELLAVFRHWADRAARDGLRELAWSLTHRISRIAPIRFPDDARVLHTLYLEKADRLDPLGFHGDAYRARCHAAAIGQSPRPVPRRLTVPPASAVANVEQSLLEEASRALEEALGRPSDPEDVEPGPTSARAYIAQVRDLWFLAGTLDPDRFQRELPQAVLCVLAADRALAAEIAGFAVDVAARRRDIAPHLRDLARALADIAAGDGAPLACGEMLMRSAERLTALGVCSRALPLAILARAFACRDRKPEHEAARRALTRRLIVIARAAGDRRLAEYLAA